MPAPTHGPNWLQNEVLTIVEQITTGEIELPAGKHATPHIVSKIVATRVGGDAPSTGAVAAVFIRWQKLGFILVNEKPFAFKAFSAAGKKLGLQGMKDELKAKRSKERAAAKAAADAAKPAKAAKATKATKATKPAKAAKSTKATKATKAAKAAQPETTDA